MTIGTESFLAVLLDYRFVYSGQSKIIAIEANTGGMLLPRLTQV